MLGNNRSLNYALWLLGRRAYTKRQIEDKLKNKRFDPKDIEVTIKRLLELKFLDDFEFARSFIRQAKQGKPKGKRRLVFELKRKGVLPETIDQALAKENFQENESELVERALKSYLKKIKGLSKEKSYNRAMGYLMRRGFGYNEAKKTTQKFLMSDL